MGNSFTQLPQQLEKTEYELIRTELNFEQYPIFTVSTFRKKSREIVRVRKNTDGSSVEQRITIGKTADGIEVGVFTPFEAKVFYALQDFWDQEGRVLNKPVVISLYKLANRLHLEIDGRNYSRLKKALTRLRQIPITWKLSYFQANKKDWDEQISFQTILSDLNLKARKEGERVRAAIAYKLDERIQRNLLENHSHPILIDTVISFQKEYAQLLYVYIDRRLAHTSRFEATLTNLWQTLDFSNEGIRYPADRKAKLMSAFQELNGKPLSTGLLSNIKVEKTADGEDYKAIFIKTARANALTPNAKKIGQPKVKTATHANLKSINAPEMARYLASVMLDQLGDQQSANFYKKVALYCSENLIFRLLSETKDAYLQGEIDSKPKIFVTKLKQEAPHLFKKITPAT